MTNHPVKYNKPSQADTWRHNWQIMRPFVHFAIKAMGLIGGALIGIIKLLPTLAEHNKAHDSKKDNRIIKI